MASIWQSWTNRKQETNEVKLLREIPLFKNLSSFQYEMVADLLYNRQYSPDETVFSKGDPATGLFIIHSGNVRIILESASDETNEVTELGEGEFFGEQALCEGHHRMATAEAKGNAEIFVLFRQELMDLLHREKDLGITVLSNLVQLLGDRLRWANETIQNLMVEEKQRSGDDDLDEE